MTREEAINLIRPIILSDKYDGAERAVNVFVTLGMLKLEEPKTPMQKLEQALRERYFRGADIINLQDALTKSGLEIVEKTKR